MLVLGQNINWLVTLLAFTVVHFTTPLYSVDFKVMPPHSTIRDQLLQLSPTNYDITGNVTGTKKRNAKTEYDSLLEIEILDLETHKLEPDSMKEIPEFRGGALSGEALLKSVSNTKTKCWMVLFLSIVVETFGTALSKHARDSSSIQLFIFACVLYIISMIGFAISLAHIEVGVAYSVWGAAGSLAVTIIGISYFGESCSTTKTLCLFLIGAGVVGLNLQDGH